MRRSEPPLRPQGVARASRGRTIIPRGPLIRPSGPIILASRPSRSASPPDRSASRPDRPASRPVCPASRPNHSGIEAQSLYLAAGAPGREDKSSGLVLFPAKTAKTTQNRRLFMSSLAITLKPYRWVSRLQPARQHTLKRGHRTAHANPQSKAKPAGLCPPDPRFFAPSRALVSLSLMQKG